jgi:hypothetical protein
MNEKLFHGHQMFRVFSNSPICQHHTRPIRKGRFNEVSTQSHTPSNGLTRTSDPRVGGSNPSGRARRIKLENWRRQVVIIVHDTLARVTAAVFETASKQATR